ncbi:MAG TPA: hypothetical protein VLA72_18010, partial [Anaerolineales bacterium]|nr:hypothetical protein [Anaerolineales bacterium]
MTWIKNFNPQAIIFDKDGTLIDFDFMWGGWTIHLAEQIHQTCGLDVREALSPALGYDIKNNKVLANSPLASKPMARLYDLTVEVMQLQGLSEQDAANIIEKAWCLPDPVLLAKPLT